MHRAGCAEGHKRSKHHRWVFEGVCILQSAVPRVILSAVIYAYCWAKVWAVKKNDVRVSDAYLRAGDIIASQLKNAAQLVAVSDYVVSELEVATFALEFCDYFRQRVPLDLDSDPDIMAAMKAHNEAIRSHEMRLEILIRMVMLIRTKRMTEEMSRYVTSNIHQTMIMMLADTLYEQVTGVTPLDLGGDFALWHEWDMSRPRRTEAILSLISRLEMELEAL